MSSIGKELDKVNQKKFELARRRNERDIKAMDNAHQEYKSDLKQVHKAEVIDIQDTHKMQVDKESFRKEKVLSEMKNNLDTTKKVTDKELKDLKESSEKEKVSLRTKLSEDRQRINSDHSLYMEELNERFNQSSGKLNRDGKSRLSEMKTQMDQKYTDEEQFNQNKINNQTEKFTTNYTEDNKKYTSLKDGQDLQFKKERLNTNLHQQNQLKKMSDTHTKNFETKDEDFRKGLKNQDLNFEKKFNDQLSRHNQDFKNLDTKNKKVVEDLKASLTKEITKVASRNDDPFFSFETLKPKLSHFEDRVEIQVAVPDHAKSDLLLTTNGKEAVLNFNRRYNDASRLADGTIHKVNKVETFTTRMPTNFVLDAKSLKSSYDSGVMTYTIKKA